MTQRFEMAKVDEARDTPTFQILDHPTIPTKASRPKKVKSTVLGALAGLAVGLFLVAVLAQLQQGKATPQP